MSSPARLTPYGDDMPGPRVVIDFPAFDTGTVTATIRRITDQQDVIVPGADRAAALGGLVRTDYYAPPGTGIRYIAEQFNAAGVSLGFTPPATTFIQVDTSFAWISSPVDPKLTLRVEMDATAGSELRDEVGATLHNIGGKRIAIVEDSYGLSGIPLSFWTQTLTQYRQALEIFRSANGLVVFRIPPPMEVPAVLHVFGVPSREEINRPGGIDDTFWGLSGSEIAPPTTQIVAAVNTYGRYTAAYSTYGAFRGAYQTYRAAQLSPPPEV